MSLAFRGRNLINSDGENNFLITSASLEDYELEAGRSLIGAAQFPETAEEATDLPVNLTDEISREIKVSGVVTRQLQYSFPPETFEKAKSKMEERRLYEWAMNPEWNLGTYTFDDLRRVWETIKTLQTIHNIAVQKLHRLQDRKRVIFKIRTREEWIDEFSKWSGVAENITQDIFADLVYDPALNLPRKKRTHVIYQPFFEIAENKIVQSNGLVRVTGIEKCTWILTSLLRPHLHDRLKSLKEKYWINEVFLPLQSSSLICTPTVSFKHRKKSSDIDLLIIDTEDKFGLVAQLKWTTALDNVSGVESDDSQFQKGVKQAKFAMEWIEENRVELAQRTKVPFEIINAVTFRPIVIGRETLPSGSFIESDVPVINEAIFNWIIREPHYANIRELWEIASEKRYLAKDGVHFTKSIPFAINWGEMKFVFQDVTYSILDRRWNPIEDIKRL